MDFPELLQPLEHPNGPCGEDLSFSPEFDALQEARRFDDPTLAQGEWVTEIKEADWAGVERLSAELLARRSKDLRVAAWFAEARCQREGLAGLADGYALLLGLCERFWDGLHPLPEEDGSLELRTGILDWWLAQTTRLLREAPLSCSPKGLVSLLLLEQARSHGGGAEPSDHAAAGDRKRADLATIDAALRDTPRQHFLDTLHALERLQAGMSGLRTLLDAQLGDEGPSFGGALDVLDDLSRMLRRYAGAQEELVSDGVATATESAFAGALADGAVVAGSGAGADEHMIRSRAEAIRQLELIAAYFRRTEPHSPVAYLADKAARWGRMPLHEWLRSVVKDEAVLCRMEELLGVEGNPGLVAD